MSDQTNYQVPIRKHNRDSLLAGCDRELFLSTAVLAGALVFSSMDIRAFVFGVTLMVVVVYLLRKAGHADPKLRDVYLRHRKYRKYYPARSSINRINIKCPGN